MPGDALERHKILDRSIERAGRGDAGKNDPKMAKKGKAELTQAGTRSDHEIWAQGIMKKVLVKHRNSAVGQKITISACAKSTKRFPQTSRPGGEKKDKIRKNSGVDEHHN